MKPPRTIEIVGGGLAGLALGLALRRAGVAVTIFEAGEYPRHRVCGEFIAGLAPSTIKRLGVGPLLADALHHREVAWFLRGKVARVQRLPEPALGISRHRLDARLADAFVRAGGDLRLRARIAQPAPKPGLVFAHGRRRGRPAWLGLKLHVRDFRLERELELHLGDDAYLGLAQIENGVVNACGLFRQRPLAARGPALLLAYLRECGLSQVAARLEGATVDDASCCAVAALAFDRTLPRAADDRIEIGDACAMIPPFTGNGMAMAFQSAEAVLAPLVAYAEGTLDWPEACRTAHTAVRRRFRVRLAAAGALHPFLLRPRRQRWLTALNRARLLPFTPLYAALH